MIINDHNDKLMGNPEIVAEIFRQILSSEDEVDRDKEHFWVVGLDTKNKIKYIDLVTLGLLNQTIVHSRETFRQAINKAVCSVLTVHNHPSGETAPSAQDIKLTETLKKSGEIIGITLIDHVIIGSSSYYSFRESGSL